MVTMDATWEYHSFTVGEEMTRLRKHWRKKQALVCFWCVHTKKTLSGNHNTGTSTYWEPQRERCISVPYPKNQTDSVMLVYISITGSNGGQKDKSFRWTSTSDWASLVLTLSQLQYCTALMGLLVCWVSWDGSSDTSDGFLKKEKTPSRSVGKSRLQRGKKHPHRLAYPVEVSDPSHNKKITKIYLKWNTRIKVYDSELEKLVSNSLLSVFQDESQGFWTPIAEQRTEVRLNKELRRETYMDSEQNWPNIYLSYWW